MKELLSTGLRGANLFQVTTDEMAKRYNDCLEFIGLPRTKLRRFSIDKMGWSPEIAQEKNNEGYLSFGLSNIVGIILSIEQAHASLHFPHYSFDKFLISRVYEELERPLMDITTQTGVCLDIENGISRFSNPFDLLMSEYYEVKLSTPLGLGEAAREQKELVARFENSDTDWQDSDARNTLIESAKAHGDLRRRNLLLHPVHFHDVSSFYTKGFGGTFIFRNYSENCDETLIILVEKQNKGVLDNSYDDVSVMQITDKKLYRKLLKLDIVSIDLGYFKENITELEYLKNDILADAIFQINPKITGYEKLTSTQKKKLIQKNEKDIPSIYFELEGIINSLGGGKEIPEVSSELAPMLSRPTQEGTRTFEETMFVLLTFIAPTNVVQLYRFNKEKFYEEYMTWPVSKRKWAIWRILNHYKKKG